LQRLQEDILLIHIMTRTRLQEDISLHLYTLSPEQDYRSTYYFV
jgi:hypothetical protein